jgi:hypothetical protein
VSVLVVAQRLGFLIKPGKEKAEQQVGQALSTSDVTAPSTCEAGQSESHHQAGMSKQPACQEHMQNCCLQA